MDGIWKGMGKPRSTLLDGSDSIMPISLSIYSLMCRHGLDWAVAVLA